MLFRDKNNNCLDVLKATFGVGSFFSKFGFIWFRYVVEYVFPFFSTERNIVTTFTE